MLLTDSMTGHDGEKYKLKFYENQQTVGVQNKYENFSLFLQIQRVNIVSLC